MAQLYRLSHYFLLQLYEQLCWWSLSRFDKPFDKTAQHVELLKTSSHITPCKAHYGEVKPLFLALPST